MHVTLKRCILIPEAEFCNRHLADFPMTENIDKASKGSFVGIFYCVEIAEALLSIVYAVCLGAIKEI